MLISIVCTEISNGKRKKKTNALNISTPSGLTLLPAIGQHQHLAEPDLKLGKGPPQCHGSPRNSRPSSPRD